MGIDCTGTFSCQVMEIEGPRLRWDESLSYANPGIQSMWIETCTPHIVGSSLWFHKEGSASGPLTTGHAGEFKRQMTLLIKHDEKE
jgi:hypothetical protein